MNAVVAAKELTGIGDLQGDVPPGLGYPKHHPNGERDTPDQHLQTHVHP